MVGIHVDVTISINVKKDDITWQYIFQWQAVEEHKQSYEHNLVIQWRLLVHVIRWGSYLIWL